MELTSVFVPPPSLITGHDAVVALGAVVLGETDHYEHVATQCAAGLRQVALETGAPVAFGVLTAREVSQAIERAAPGPANKGAEAAEAAVTAANALNAIRDSHVAIRKTESPS